MPKDKLLITGGTGSFGNAYLNKAISENRFFIISLWNIIIISTQLSEAQLYMVSTN